jgi:imidazolonepropionase-like amidohydrolase
MTSIKRRVGLLTGTAVLALSVGPLAPGTGTAAEVEGLVLRPGHVLDVRTGRLRDDVVVRVQGDRIVAVDGAGTEELSDARVIDLPGLTLLPGLIDSHVHLTYELEGDWINQAVKESLADLALRGARNARRTLMAGFTTVRDVGAWEFSDVALARAVERGWIDGPRIIPSGNMIGATGGHCDITGFRPGIRELGPKEGIADGVDEVIKAVRYQIKHGARVIKVCATAGVMSFEHQAGALQYCQAELDAVVEEASRHDVKVAAHAHGTEGIIAAVKAGVASVEHGSMLDDEALALMKERGTYLVPTVYTWRVPGDYPEMIQRKIDEVQGFIDGSVRAAIAAGIPIAFGTDAGTFPHGHNAREFKELVDLGMTPIDAIRAATLSAVDLLGVDDRGVIEPGTLADLIAVRGNPLEDVTVLEDVPFVMIGGRVVKSTGADVMPAE